MEIYTPSQARANLFKLLKYVKVAHEPVYIVGRDTKSVLISEEDYRSMVETAYINSIPGLADSILEASKEPLESYTDTIDWDNV